MSNNNNNNYSPRSSLFGASPLQRRNNLSADSSQSGFNNTTTSTHNQQQEESNTELLDHDNEQNLGYLSSAVRKLRDVTVSFDNELLQQNRVLGGLSNQIDGANSGVNRTNTQLDSTSENWGVKHTCILSMVFFVILLILYYTIRAFLRASEASNEPQVN
eukprot:gb/GECH01012644.1/.p1 GENE.gb/GECH01012644.1/~~gb/GECH01012644.1/.p1  ORF type:complete len:160 (+),score=38.21 gb/GECH01012644.1/:1-480(+)